MQINEARENLGCNSDPEVPREGWAFFNTLNARGEEHVSQVTTMHVFADYAFGLGAKAHHRNQMWVSDLAKELHLSQGELLRNSSKGSFYAIQK